MSFLPLIEDAGQRLSAAPPGAGQPLPALSSPLASANLSPQLLLLFLLSAFSTLTNFSIEQTPQQGRTRVFLILLRASRPQPGEHPDSRADAGRRS